MRARRRGDYSKNQVKTRLSDPSRAHVCVSQGHTSGAVATPVAANMPWPESPAKPSHDWVVNKGHTVIKPAHLEIALSVAPRLNQMSEICTGIIKAMRFTILSARGSYSADRLFALW